MTPSAYEGAHTLEQLAAINEVSQLKARYFRFMDLKQWDDWEALYTSDAVLDAQGEAAAMASLGFPAVPAETLIFRTPAVIRQSVSSALEGVKTAHHGHMGELRFLDAGRIAATWSMQDVLRYPEGGCAPVRGFDGFGHYQDVYVRQDGQWRIESILLTRLLINAVH